MLIAASAIEFGYMLYTTNRKDFETPRLTFFTPTNQL
jgi:predicted nucleic acid-binding protein